MPRIHTGVSLALTLVLLGTSAGTAIAAKKTKNIELHGGANKFELAGRARM